MANLVKWMDTQNMSVGANGNIFNYLNTLPINYSLFKLTGKYFVINLMSIPPKTFINQLAFSSQWAYLSWLTLFGQFSCPNRHNGNSLSMVQLCSDKHWSLVTSWQESFKKRKETALYFIFTLHAVTSILYPDTGFLHVVSGVSFPVPLLMVSTASWSNQTTPLAWRLNQYQKRQWTWQIMAQRSACLSLLYLDLYLPCNNKDTLKCWTTNQSMPGSGNRQEQSSKKDKKCPIPNCMTYVDCISQVLWMEYVSQH